MNGRRIGLGVVLATTMAAATFAPMVFSVLATTLREEFGAARWQIGALVTVVMAVGALLSPAAGTIADRIPPRHSTALTLAVAAVGFIAMALAPGFWWLAAAGVFAGVGQALCNPATNRLIMTQVEAGSRGLLTGIKQAGVQVGNVAGGIVLPLGVASMLGWRGTTAMVTTVSLFGLAVLGWLVRGRRPVVAAVATIATARMPAAVVRLAVYAGLMGLVMGTMFTFLPSFAQEDFAWTTAAGGALVSVFGAVGFVARLTAGRLSERWFGHHRTMAGMAVISGGAAAMLAWAPAAGWLWPAAVLIGLGATAWNVVANVSVMELSPPGRAGRGSGMMNSGFLAGMAAGPPLFGWSVDLSQTYRPGWLVPFSALSGG